MLFQSKALQLNNGINMYWTSMLKQKNLLVITADYYSLAVVDYFLVQVWYESENCEFAGQISTSAIALKGVRVWY